MSIEINGKKIQSCEGCALYENCKKSNRENDESGCLWSTIHFIVKDYKRMFNRFQELEPSIKKKNEKLKEDRDRIIELIHKLDEKQVEAMSDERLKTMFRTLTSSVKRLKEEKEALQNEVKLLYAQIDETKNSRNAVVEAVTADLEEKLEEANNKIKLLASAVVDPEKADSVFLQSCKVHTIETDDDKKWMAGAMRQLEKASMKLLTVDERLSRYEETLKENNGELTTSVEKIIKKAMNSISSTISHIECFMDKVGNIKIEEDE
ncbi:hypothetical protein SAMN04487851_11476 [Prevotella sp. tc2-28]|uniref:hypothetical protein n=1 Tax=Prevotella sp. tc2-28 TaxID=1761888 RepID=UPI000897ED88|nr:hypothetical protein [Prevotella sp. tc2-28]SEA80052.1 hypothetical protein SAMN04487851_11476 [Prevotella sp. tc2-28]